MVDIETHKIIDLLESRQEDDVIEWLKTYPNLEVISRDGGIIYKSASDKAHPKAIQVSDRFHVLKNLTEYAKDALKRILSNHIKIEEDSKVVVSKTKKKYEFKKKWDLILKVKELREKKHRVIDIAETLGITEKTVIEYNKIPLEDKEKYEKMSAQELREKINQEEKWKLIQEVQEEYKKCPKYRAVGRKFNLDRKTVKKYLSITEPPIHDRKGKTFGSKLDKYKEEIIRMNNEGYKSSIILEKIKEEGYKGTGSLLRNYLSKIKKGAVQEKGVKQIVERTTMISLLYKEIDEVKNITKEIFERVIESFPKAKVIYDCIKEFKEIMFSKKEGELEDWIHKTKKYKIPEMDSFITGVERDIEAIKNGIKYEYNNGLAEGSVNKIKVIKRIMYGRCSFNLLKQKVLLV